MNQRLTDIRRAQLDQLLSGDTNMAGGGLLKAVVKAAKPAVKAVQEVLPLAEREANLAKMLEGSAVKDRLYHGTGDDITEFRPSRIGAMGPGTYLTKRPEVASGYSDVTTRRGSANQPNVLPVYAQIKKPFNISNVNKSSEELFKHFDPSGKLTDDEVIELVKKAGYDAIHALEDGEINVLDPRKIKSAIGNRGTYDTSVPDINEAQGGLVHLAGGGRADSDYTLMGATRQDNENKPYPKTERMNLGVKAVKSGLDKLNRLIDTGPSVGSVLGNVVGAVPFVGPDLRKRMEDSTLTIPYEFQRSATNPRVATGVNTAKVPTTDILDALKMSDITGGTGASNLLGSVGKGYAPNPMDVLDTLGFGLTGYGAAKAGAKGVKKAARAGERFAEKAVPKIMERGGLGAEMLGALGQNTQSRAVKQKGGNWVDSEIKRSLDKLKQDDSYPQSYIDSLKEDLAKYDNNTNLPPDAVAEIEQRRRDLAHMDQTNAFNKWVDTKAGSYVRNQMATPDDPVLKMLDVRAAKIEADYQAGQKRLAKLDERIAQAPTGTQEERNTLANLQRTRAQRAAEIESDRELAMNSMLPGGTDNAGYDYLRNSKQDLIDTRKEAGFPTEGYGQSDAAKAWEAAADFAAQPIAANKLQGQPEKIAALKAATKELEQYQSIELPDKFRAYLDRGSFSENDKQALMQKTPKTIMVDILGDRKRSEALHSARAAASKEASIPYLSMAEENPYIAKLPPNATVYSTYGAEDLGIDHILDVLKQDVASGAIKLEDLNKITMDQAVKRAAEYDFDMAKKARDAVAQSRETMPVYKEYPEGYKWVQLTRPGEFNAESNAMGHSVRGYEPEKGHPDWTPESGDSGYSGYGHGGWEAIKSGEAKVYSLVDPNGRPHTTIEVRANPDPYPVSGEAFAKLSPAEKAQFSEHVRQWRRRNPDVEELTDENVVQALKEAGVPPQPDIITQIKGKGNARPQEKYDPYIQDFVKSSNWEDVRDLHNTGLTKIGNDYFTAQEAESKFKPMVADALNFLNTHPSMESHRANRKAYFDFSGDPLTPEYKELDRAAGKPISPNVPYTYNEIKALLENPEDWTSRDQSIYVPISTALKKLNEAKQELGIDLTPPEPHMAVGGSVGLKNALNNLLRTDKPEVHMSVGGAMAKVAKAAEEAAKAAKVAGKAAEYLPGVHYADPLKMPTMKMSEALGNAGAEGKTLNFTETDRSRVFGPNRGGAGFSGLQHYSLPHQEANTVWGFGNKTTAEKKIRQNDPENTIWTTYAGSPNQHKSNTIVVKDALNQLQSADKQGLVNPKQIEFINDRIREAVSQNGNPLFPKDFDITDPKAFDYATTFDRRAAISDALMGIGVKKPMISKEFKAANPGVKWLDAANIDAILRRETDPAMLNANTFDVGPHLFTMDNGIIERPDLNEAFPYQVTGTDLGLRYELAPMRAAAPDWIKARNIKPDEPINAWAMSRAAPSQFVSEDYLTSLQKQGKKKGGLAQTKKVKRHGNTVPH